jgi:hypothetical protein
VGVAAGLAFICSSYYDFVVASTSTLWSASWDWMYSQPFLLVCFPLYAAYEMFLTSLLFPMSQQVLWNITTNEFNNRDRYDYIEYPGFTPWTGTSHWKNFKEFFLEPNKIDWTQYYIIQEEV